MEDFDHRSILVDSGSSVQWEISLQCRLKLSNKDKQSTGRTLRINALVEASPGIAGFTQISCSDFALYERAI